jgi:radical SAM modification target selenobiotic family peptide
MQADKLKRVLAGLTVAGLLSSGGAVYAQKTG